MIKQLLNSAIAKYCDLSVPRSARSDKSEYSAQLYRIIVKYVTSREPFRKQIWFLKSYVQIKNTKFPSRVEIISLLAISPVL